MREVNSIAKAGPEFYFLFMIKKILLLLVFAFSLTSFSRGSSESGPVPVEDFEVSKYLGVWYEIGSIPQKFQKGCECTRAEYTLRSETKLNVLNQCRKKGVDGPITDAKGKARFIGSSNIGDLEVSFFLWFYGSYRIIALDQENYEWSVVSNDEAKTLWILSRTPDMPQSQIDKLLDLAKQQGVDISKFVLQRQAGCWVAANE
jgi:apolipoprotein D and lipocalin family protein